MDFDHLITFLEIAKQGSFSRAGQKLYRSQPAVSAQIRQLEQEYGQKLFDRVGKSVRLTVAGETLQEFAGRLLTLRNESLRAVADQAVTPRGTLAVGANEATCLYVCRKYLRISAANSPPCRSAFTGISATKFWKKWKTAPWTSASSQCL